MNFFESKQRSVVLGEYIAAHHATVREVAARFGVSKSTVHKDVTTVLREVDRRLFDEVSQVLQKNKEERHLRGGEATKRKFAAPKK
jgi:putative DeoR family transcriptional regulator (stage III sporulation protein D)